MPVVAPATPIWPAIVDVVIGERVTVVLGARTVEVEVLAVEERKEPDRNLTELSGGTLTRDVTCRCRIDGEEICITGGPFAWPGVGGGCRVGVETTRAIEERNARATFTVQGDLRLAIQDVGADWGPDDWMFPIAAFRHGACSYANTWNGLVPGTGRIYYHRGEDWAVRRGRHGIVAPVGGRLDSWPDPCDGGSNTIRIVAEDGTVVRLAHCDTEGLAAGLGIGDLIHAGQHIAHCGATWQGHTRMGNPHLHLDVERGGNRINPWPILARAYRRSFPGDLLVAAGGTYFGFVGQQVDLDGSGSRPGPEDDVDARWCLPDGTMVDGWSATWRCAAPGWYLAQLEVSAPDGTRDIDSCVIRVYDPEGPDAQGGRVAWISTHPHRDIRPGDAVELLLQCWVELGEATIDWGDGSVDPVVPGEALSHSYAGTGIYMVRLDAQTTGGLPLVDAVRIVVVP